VKRPSKYKNKPTVVDGIRFASQAEARRDAELRLLESAGKISQLERQVPYELAHAVTLRGETRKKPALRYVADFRYFSVEAGHYIVEDVKSPATAKEGVFRIKRHLMKSVHGIDVVIS